MPMFLTKGHFREEASRVRPYTVLAESDETFLRKQVSRRTPPFDFFISYSSLDVRVVLGIDAWFGRWNYNVYIDRIVDPELSKENVTAATADRIRDRMMQSNVLIYAFSDNTIKSKWMPWELGFFDGYRSRVVVLPITDSEKDNFPKQEYVGLYPFLDGGKNTAWVNRGDAPARIFGNFKGSYVGLTEWMNGWGNAVAAR